MIKTKIKKNTITEYIQIFNIPKDNKYCTCLSVMLLDSIFVNLNKKHYLQTFLEECKYAIEKQKSKYNERRFRIIAI